MNSCPPLPNWVEHQQILVKIFVTSRGDINVHALLPTTLTVRIYHWHTHDDIVLRTTWSFSCIIRSLWQYSIAVCSTGTYQKTWDKTWRTDLISRAWENVSSIASTYMSQYALEKQIWNIRSTWLRFQFSNQPLKLDYTTEVRFLQNKHAFFVQETWFPRT